MQMTVNERNTVFQLQNNISILMSLSWIWGYRGSFQQYSRSSDEDDS